MTGFGEITEFCLGEMMPAELARRGLPQKQPSFILHGLLAFMSLIAGGVIEVADLYITNLANIPWWLWFAMSPDDPQISAASVVHDWLYQYRGVVRLRDGSFTKLTRDQCDRILAYEAMAALGAPKWKQHAVYFALKWFGDRWN